MVIKCEHGNKSLRKTKRVDFVDRKIHFSCITKLKKEKWDEDLKKLAEYLKSKSIELLI